MQRQRNGDIFGGLSLWLAPADGLMPWILLRGFVVALLGLVPGGLPDGPAAIGGKARGPARAGTGLHSLRVSSYRRDRLFQGPDPPWHMTTSAP